MDLERITPLDLIETANARGRLRLEQPSTDQTITNAEIVGYDECENGYNELAEGYAAAQSKLYEVLSVPAEVLADRSESGRGWTAWRWRRVAEPNGKPIELAYEISLAIKHGRLTQLHDRRGRTIHPVTVSTHVVHTPTHGYSGKESRHFTDVMTGKVLFDADKTTAQLAQDQIKLKWFKTLNEDTRAILNKSARFEALEPWVDSFLDIADVPTGWPFEVATKWLNLSQSNDSDVRLVDLLTKPVANQEAALELLKAAFKPGYLNSVYELLDSDIVTLQSELDAANIRKRFEWLMNNVTAIRTSILTLQRAKVSCGYRDLFTASLDAERPKIAEIAELADALQVETIDITHCAPTGTAQAAI